VGSSPIVIALRIAFGAIRAIADVAQFVEHHASNVGRPSSVSSVGQTALFASLAYRALASPCMSPGMTQAHCVGSGPTSARRHGRKFRAMFLAANARRDIWTSRRCEASNSSKV
jgi:hypothetical protein